MEQNTLRKQRELTDRLNRYRNEYYNYNNPSVSDEVYDRLFDELHKLEQETGIQMSNSPTVTVGYSAYPSGSSSRRRSARKRYSGYSQ